MKEKWSSKQAWEWYKSYPWLTGCNFLPSNVINRLDMWQSLNHKEHLEVADQELGLAESLGFNLVRYWVNFDVFYFEKNFFYESLENYISLAAKHHQYVILVLTYEEDIPYVGNNTPNHLGIQRNYHNHFNREYVSYDKRRIDDQYRHYLEIPELRPLFIEMITSVVNKYKNDKRVILWNTYNEPGALLGDRCLPLVKEIDEIVRSLDPSQPISIDIYWNIKQDGSFQSNSAFFYEESDVVSFHCYSDSPTFIEQLNRFEKYYDKPMIVTEWLHRIYKNNIVDCYPCLKQHNIGSCVWGFVSGLTNTYMPWDGFIQNQKKGEQLELDLSLWQHELFYNDLTPYNEEEIKTIQDINYDKR